MTINSLAGSNQTPTTNKFVSKAVSAPLGTSVQDTAIKEAYTVELNNPKDSSQVSPETPDRNSINTLKQQILANPATAIAAQANSQPENVLSLLISE